MNSVQVTSHELRGAEKGYTVYRVEVTMGQSRWIVFRRYKQFLQLYTQLKKKRTLPEGMDLKFPPKQKPFGNNFKKQFLDNRLAALSEVMEQLTAVSTIFQDELLQQFLSPHIKGDIQNADHEGEVLF